jgi:hypothetical protein
MHFDRPLLKLPIRFDADALAAEVRALPQSVWVPHPTGFVGNEAVRLVSPNGTENDELQGPMAPTRNLLASPYMMKVMGVLGGVWSRSRLMGLGAGAEVPGHIDSHYHWRTHLRIHIPVVTNPQVEFTCGGETVHMAPGEAWIFDSFRWHEVHNRGSEQRVHLVLDTVVTERLWDMIAAAQSDTPPEPVLVPSGPPTERLLFEQVNAPQIMSSWEVRCHIAFVLEQAAPHPLLEQVRSRLDRFADAWSSLWALFGTNPEGVPYYQSLLAEEYRQLQEMDAGEVRLNNGFRLTAILHQLIFMMAIAPTAASVPAAVAGRAVRSQLTR